MQEMKPIIMGMGLYWHMWPEKTEMLKIIHLVSLATYHLQMKFMPDRLP
jgi:hypothetical protein